jgi:cytochrome P450
VTSPTTSCSRETSTGGGTVPQSRQLVRALEDLPGPSGLPLLGSLLHLDIARAHTILGEWADRFGPLFHFRVARQSVLAVADVHLINELLRDRPGGFRRRRALQDAMLELGIDGVFTAEGLDWRRQRKLAMHALNTEHLRDFFGHLEQVTARLQRRWDRAAASRERVDAQRDLMRFTVDVTSGLAFGNDLNTLEQEGDVIQQHLDKVFPALARRILAPFPYWRWFKLPSDRRLDSAMVEILKLVSALVAAARDRVAANESSGAPGNFLDAMLMAQSDDAASFTDAEIAGNTLIMLLAGEDTTANTLAWMMHLMLEHPDVQSKMQAEADRVVGASDRPAEFGMTEELRYIEAVAHEAMRLLPVAPFIALEPNEDTVIGDVRVPKETGVYLLTAHAAAAAENFADAKQFRPERWLDGANHGLHNSKAFLPFGAGPRFCPGRHLAMLEIKMVTAMLCRNFSVLRAPHSPPTEEVFSFTMMPRNLWVTLERRARPAAPPSSG